MDTCTENTINLTGTLEEGEVKVWNLTEYLQNIVLNTDNLFPDPLFERKLWYPGVYNKGSLIYDGERIILDGRAENKGYTRQAIKFDVSEEAYVFEIEIMLLDDSYPNSYPLVMGIQDANGSNLTDVQEIFPSPSNLKLGKWYKLRKSFPATEGASKFFLVLGISDTGGYLAYRRPKLVKGTDTGIFDTFDFDITDKIQALADKVNSLAE